MSLHDDVMNVHGLALFYFVRNVSLDVHLSLHGIENVDTDDITLACNILIAYLKPICAHLDGEISKF